MYKSTVLFSVHYLFETVRIRIRIKQSDPDPYQIEKQDTDKDPYQSEKQGPDPDQKGLDLQHWFRLQLRLQVIHGNFMP
jgi:hypothetical protein